MGSEGKRMLNAENEVSMAQLTPQLCELLEKALTLSA
jgi:hypothetical protein